MHYINWRFTYLLTYLHTKKFDKSAKDKWLNTSLPTWDFAAVSWSFKSSLTVFSSDSTRILSAISFSRSAVNSMSIFCTQNKNNQQCIHCKSTTKQHLQSESQRTQYYYPYIWQINWSTYLLVIQPINRSIIYLNQTTWSINNTERTRKK